MMRRADLNLLFLAAFALASCVPVTPPVREEKAVPAPRQPAAPPPAAPPKETRKPKPRGPSPAELRKRARERRALDLLHKGDLARALIEWKVLRTLAPQNREIAEQIAATQALIRHRADQHQREGEEAYRRGDFDRAREAFLKELALDPFRQPPRRELREIDRHDTLEVQLAKLKRMRERMARRAGPGGDSAMRGAPAEDQARDYLETGITLFKDGDYEASILEIGKYLASYPDDPEARSYYERAKTKVRERNSGGTASRSAPQAPASRPTPTVERPATAPPAKPEPANEEKAAASPPSPSASGEGSKTPATVDEASKAAAQKLYEKGVRASRTDLAKAIEYWQESLRRDPNHVQARLRLERAQKMLENLREMKPSR